MRKLLPRSPASRGRVGLVNRENGTHSTNAEESVSLLTIFTALTLFGMGGGVKTTPLAKILNNTRFGQAKGLPELFTEQNLVLHVF